jgi:hypothetical protein
VRWKDPEAKSGVREGSKGTDPNDKGKESEVKRYIRRPGFPWHQ